MHRILQPVLFLAVICASGCVISPPVERVLVRVASDPLANATIIADPKAGANRSPDSIFVGSNGRHNILRGLVRFDLSSIPANAIIVSATLELSVLRTRTVGNPVRLYCLLESWEEGTTNGDGGEATGSGGPTWVSRSESMGAWSSAGGSIKADVSASIAMDGPNRYAMDAPTMIADVQGWISNPGSNHGWLLVGDEDTAPTVKRLGSRQHPDLNMRPALAITYFVK